MPLTIPAAVAAVIAGLRSGLFRPAIPPLSLAAPCWGFFLCVGVIRSTHAFWPLPAWIALTILTADYSGGGQAGAWSRSTGTRGGSSRPSPSWPPASAWAHSVEPFPGVTPIRSLLGWDEIANRAARLRSTLPAGSFLPRRGAPLSFVPPQLAYHLRAPKDVHSKNLLGEEGLQFTYWAEMKVLRGHDAVIVAEGDWSPTDLKVLLHRHFRRVDEDGIPLVVGGSGLPRGVKEERYVFLCRT